MSRNPVQASYAFCEGQRFKWKTRGFRRTKLAVLGRKAISVRSHW
jgi:hypothetical protein